MDLLLQNLGIPSGVAGWQVLQRQSDTSFAQFTNDPVLKSNIAYFQANAPKAATAQQLLADPRLQEVALTAYGLTAQIGLNALMQKVLNSDPTDPKSVANQLTDARFRQISTDFGYGTSVTNTAAVQSGATVTISGFDGTNTFNTFSGTFGGVTLNNVDLSGATTRAQVAATLQAAFQGADGGKAITVTSNGLDIQFSDASGRGTMSGAQWTASPDAGGNTVQAFSPTALVAGAIATSSGTLPASASKTTIPLSGFDGSNGFTSFSGTFGGVTLSNVDLSGTTTRDQVASRLQAAFQKADGKRTDITVRVNGLGITMTDAQGRGGGGGLSWTATADAQGNTVQAGVPSSIVQGARATSTTSTPATASTASIEVEGLDGTNGFASFSGTFGRITFGMAKVPAIDLSGATTREQMASRLQAAFQKADGGTSITVKVSGLGLVFSDSQGRGVPSGLGWTASADGQGNTATAGAVHTLAVGSKVVPAVPAVASQADVGISGLTGGGADFLNFSGTFAGVTVKNLDLSKGTSLASLAGVLTTAFQNADGGRSDITVTALSDGLHFSDGLGRGSASGFVWTSASGGPQATAPTGVVAGNPQQLTKATVGPKVSSADFIQSVVQKYTEAQFQSVVGNTSNTLRTALYAQQQIPQILSGMGKSRTDWYSVISDANLMSVFDTVFHLPSTFSSLDVDQQNSVLKSKMSIQSLNDSAKLKTLLNNYVGIASINEAASGGTFNPALSVMSSVTGHSYSGSSAAALLLNT